MKPSLSTFAKLNTNALENFPQAIERAELVKLVVLDVDGVLTDGALYVGQDGKESIKVFDSLDGHGIKLLASTGIKFAIISGRKSTMVEARAKELGIDFVFMAVKDKLATLNELLKDLQLGLQDCAAVGDDWPDLPVMSRVQLAAAPAQAHQEVLRIAHFVAARKGGNGAVREICDLILKAQGHYDRLLKDAFAS